MNEITALMVVALSALIHASFQLGVSMMTLLSSHSSGKRDTAHRSLRLILTFLLGTALMTALLVMASCYITGTLFGGQIPIIAWSLACGLLIGVGLAVWFFYYRRGNGTALWLPRSFARFLDARIRTTRSRAESFSLGMTGVMSELLFILAPIVAASMTITTLPLHLQIVAVILYIVVALSGLIVVTMLIGSGHQLAIIQRWREQNKRFLQFAAGSGLIILGIFLYTQHVIAVSGAVSL